MVQADLGAFLADVDTIDAGLLRDGIPHFAEVHRIVDVNMGDLMIAHGKRRAGKGVELLAEGPCRAASKPGLPKDAIE